MEHKSNCRSHFYALEILYYETSPYMCTIARERSNKFIQKYISRSLIRIARCLTQFTFITGTTFIVIIFTESHRKHTRLFIRMKGEVNKIFVTKTHVVTFATKKMLISFKPLKGTKLRQNLPISDDENLHFVYKFSCLIV